MKIFFRSVSLVFLLLSPTFVWSELSNDQEELLKSLPPDQREGVLEKMTQIDELNQEVESTFEEFNTSAIRPQKKVLTDEEKKAYAEESKNWVYGYELFNTSPTTFSPATEIPVPNDYVLGPGDQLNINIYGGSKNIKQSPFISRNGLISLPDLGPINLTGLTLDQARILLTEKVAQELTGSGIFITLGKLRTITVYILGAAYKPGAYKISSLSTISNALFVSGGVDVMGSVRNIEIKRKGKVVHRFDLYKFFLEGDTSNDIRLQQGDAIFVPLIEKRVRVYGDFKRPFLYEIKKTEKIKDLIEIAGGLTTEAKLYGKIEFTRFNKNSSIERLEIDTSDESDLNLALEDGDVLSAHSLSLERGVVELKGEFQYPGYYRIEKNERLSEIIKRAGGLTENAYTYGSVFTRVSVAEQQELSFRRSADYLEKTIAEALTGGSLSGLTAESFAPVSGLIKRLRELKPAGRQVIESDPLRLKSDPRLDFILRDGDVLTIPQRPNGVTVVGEVLNPSTHLFRTGQSSQDYVQSAGGFANTADEKGIFLILPNGETQVIKNDRFFNKDRPLVPGSTIVVPRDPRPFDWLALTKTITPILADSATAIATVEALLKD